MKRSPIKLNNHLFISIFSGAMGLDLGLEHAEWKCVLAVDNDPSAIATIKHNKPELPLIEDDIRNYTASDLLEIAKVSKREIFAIVGGPPCQAFSSAGKRMGLDDERGNVFLKFLELIKGISPKCVVIENVRGLLSMPLGNLPKTPYPVTVPDKLLRGRHGLMLMIMEQLRDMGYALSFTLYNTANYGVPQIRERVIILCNKGEVRIPLIPPQYFPDREPKWKTLRDAIGDLDDEGMRFMPFPESRLRFYRLLKEGQNWRDLPLQLQKAAMGNSYHLGGGKTGFYRRLSWDKPSPTLVSSPTMPATDLCHPEQLRPLSVEEYARIQQFPVTWEFKGGISDLYRQIGNAVPVGFGKVIGEHIIKFHQNKRKYLGSRTEQTKKVTYSRYHDTDHVYFEEILNKYLLQTRLI